MAAEYYRIILRVEEDDSCLPIAILMSKDYGELLIKAETYVRETKELYGKAKELVNAGIETNPIYKQLLAKDEWAILWDYQTNKPEMEGKGEYLDFPITNVITV